MTHYAYTVHITPAEEGGFLARIPALNESVTQGETYQEAVMMAQDLMRVHVESLAMRGLPIPQESPVPSTLQLGVSVGIPVIS